MTLEKCQTFRLMLAIFGALNDIAIDKPRVSNGRLRVNHFDLLQHFVVVSFRWSIGQSIGQRFRDVRVRFSDIIPGTVVGSSLVAASKDGRAVAIFGAVKFCRTLVPFFLVGVQYP